MLPAARGGGQRTGRQRAFTAEFRQDETPRPGAEHIQHARGILVRSHRHDDNALVEHARELAGAGNIVRGVDNDRRRFQHALEPARPAHAREPRLDGLGRQPGKTAVQ